MACAMPRTRISKTSAPTCPLPRLLSLYRASKREREGPIAEQWEGEGVPGVPRERPSPVSLRSPPSPASKRGRGDRRTVEGKQGKEKVPQLTRSSQRLDSKAPAANGNVPAALAATASARRVAT